MTDLLADSSSDQSEQEQINALRIALAGNYDPKARYCQGCPVEFEYGFILADLREQGWELTRVA